MKLCNCGQKFIRNNAKMCRECYRKINVKKEHLCPKCKQPMIDYRSKLCLKCMHKERGKKVVQYKGYDIIAIWDSISQVNRLTGISRRSIQRVLNGKYKSAYGFNWMYHSPTEPKTTIGDRSLR